MALEEVAKKPKPIKPKKASPKTDTKTDTKTEQKQTAPAENKAKPIQAKTNETESGQLKFFSKKTTPINSKGQNKKAQSHNEVSLVQKNNTEKLATTPLSGSPAQQGSLSMASKRPVTAAAKTLGIDEDTITRSSESVKHAIMVFSEIANAVKNGATVFNGKKPISAGNLEGTLIKTGVLERGGVAGSSYFQNGNYTLRLSDHYSNASTFATRGENLSVVILDTSKTNRFQEDGESNVVEAVFKKRYLDSHKDAFENLVKDMARFVATGEYHDTAGAIDYHVSGSDAFVKEASQRLAKDKENISRKNSEAAPQNAEIVSEVPEENASNIRYSKRTIQSEYDEAIESGDVDWQKNLVAEAAYRNGYTVGAYHGSNVDNITVFRTKSDSTKPQKLQLLFGTHFTRNRTFAEIYSHKAKNSKGTSRITSKTGRVYDVYLKLGKNLDLVTAKNYQSGEELYKLYEDLPENIRKRLEKNRVGMKEYTDFETKEMGGVAGKYVNTGAIENALDMMSPVEAQDFLTEHGYDSVSYVARYNTGTWDNNAFSKDESVIMLNPENIKSADPVTYDDNGNIIPLSERFNEANEDIRYSKKIDQYTEKEYNERGWVAVNDVLTVGESKSLYSQFADFKKRKYYYPVTEYGEAMILTMDNDTNVPHLSFVKGTIKNPVITKVIGVQPHIDVMTQNRYLEELRSYGRNYRSAWEFVRSYAGEEVFDSKSYKDFESYRNIKKQAAGIKKSNGNREEYSGRGNSSNGDFEAEIKTSRNNALETLTDLRQTAEIVSEVPEENASNIRYSKRTKPAPENTIDVFKLMRLGADGKLYPLFIDSAVGVDVGVWQDADSPDLSSLKKLPSGVYLFDDKTGKHTSIANYYAGDEKAVTRKLPSKADVYKAAEDGKRWVFIEDVERSQRRYGGEARKYWNIGVNGSGSVSTFAMRPGWHAGSLPSMRQIGKGANKNLRDDSFVWVKGRMAADVDYQAEANKNPDGDIPTHIPTDGYYMMATNPNKAASQADKIGWYISGAFIADEMLSDDAARSYIDEWNKAHPSQTVEYDYERESGKVFDAKQMKLVDRGSQGGKMYSKKATPIKSKEQSAKTSQEVLQSHSSESIIGNTEGIMYAQKYAVPHLSQEEWSLLNRTLDTEIRLPDKYIDEYTKWAYASEKGISVFALYGIGDGTEATVLYASSGKAAAHDNIDIFEFMEGKKRGTYKNRAGFAGWARRIRSFSSESSSYISNTENRQSENETNKLYAGTRERNRGTALDGSEKNSVDTSAKKLYSKKPTPQQKAAADAAAAVAEAESAYNDKVAAEKGKRKGAILSKADAQKLQTARKASGVIPAGYSPARPSAVPRKINGQNVSEFARTAEESKITGKRVLPAIQKAEAIGANRTYLCKIFKEQNQITITHYVTELKMNEAKRLLGATNKSLADIAFYLGFFSQSHFQNIFYKYCDITPKTFREQAAG